MLQRCVVPSDCLAQVAADAIVTMQMQLSCLDCLVTLVVESIGWSGDWGMFLNSYHTDAPSSQDGKNARNTQTDGTYKTPKPM